MKDGCDVGTKSGKTGILDADSDVELRTMLYNCSFLCFFFSLFSSSLFFCGLGLTCPGFSFVLHSACFFLDLTTLTRDDCFFFCPCV